MEAATEEVTKDCNRLESLNDFDKYGVDYVRDAGQLTQKKREGPQGPQVEEATLEDLKKAPELLEGSNSLALEKWK